MNDSDFVMRVLRATSFDLCDTIWWRTDGEYAPVTFMVLCSDSFEYACADSEPVTPGNIGELEQAIADCVQVYGRTGDQYGPLLFVARVRRRPLIPSALRHIPEELRPLFEAATIIPQAERSEP